MMSSQLASAILLCLSAASAPWGAAVLAFDGSISTESTLGRRLLSNARQLENNNNYY
jgi:hypothetical protein